MNSHQQDLYSRQIRSIGIEPMKNIQNTQVLLIGLDTMGQEIAKCLCLLGIQKLVIFDNRKVDKWNLNSYFMLDKSDINNRFDRALKPKLIKLNKYVEIEINQNVNYCKFDIIIQTHIFDVLPIEINQFCRKYSIKYILALLFGFNGYIFNDFGNKHIVYDSNGEALKQCFISNFKVIDSNIHLFSEKAVFERRYSAAY